MDPVAVVAAAHVARHAEQAGRVHGEAGLFEELSHQGVFGRLAEVDASSGEPPERWVVVGVAGANEDDPAVVHEHAVGADAGVLLTHGMTSPDRRWLACAARLVKNVERHASPQK